MAKKAKPTVNRKDFITVLSQMTPAEVNKMISEKGKKPKPIVPFIVTTKGIP